MSRPPLLLLLLLLPAARCPAPAATPRLRLSFPGECAAGRAGECALQVQPAPRFRGSRRRAPSGAPSRCPRPLGTGSRPAAATKSRLFPPRGISSAGQRKGPFSPRPPAERDGWWHGGPLRGRPGRESRWDGSGGGDEAAGGCGPCPSTSGSVTHGAGARLSALAAPRNGVRAPRNGVVASGWEHALGIRPWAGLSRVARPCRAAGPPRAATLPAGALVLLRGPAAG